VINHIWLLSSVFSFENQRGLSPEEEKTKQQRL